jgi:hypothetical protein
VIAVALILCWTLFGLSTVSVVYHSTTQNLTLDDEEIVEAGNFRYGACVFFEGKNKSIENINNYAKQNKDFAYLRVINIETKFPNKYIIHVAEREELFAVEYNNNFLICDRDLRVLKIESKFTSTEGNAILVKGLEVTGTSEVGDFLDCKQSAMKNFYSVMTANNRNLMEQCGKIKEIVLDSYNDEITGKEYVSLTMNTFQNRVLKINNIDFAFENKVSKLFATETALYSQNVDENERVITNSNGEPVLVVKSKNNEYLSYETAKDLKGDDGNAIYSETDATPLTYEILTKCCITVDNLTLTDYIKRTEKDIYYSLVEM